MKEVLHIHIRGTDAFIRLKSGETLNTSATTAADPAALAGMLRRVYGWRIVGQIPQPRTEETSHG